MTGMPASVIRDLKREADPKKAAFFPSFFKTGKGQYGEGDIFLGVTVPKQRMIAKKHRDLSLSSIAKLLKDKRHEARLTALLILVEQFKRGDAKERKRIFDFYLKNLEYVNNWDLVDSSAPQIVGAYLLDRPRAVLMKLARSKHLWSERVAMVATQALIREGELDETFSLAKYFISHPHDLMHKATGWMLREAGKKNEKALTRFLDRYAKRMPRTMLRYAIERLPESKRRAYLLKSRT